MDNNYTVNALYDGGWTSDDIEQLMIEYGLTREQAQDICEQLRDLELDEIPLF